MKLESWSTTGVKIDKQHALNYKHGVPLMPISIRILQILECQNSTKIGIMEAICNLKQFITYLCLQRTGPYRIKSSWHS